MKRVVEENRVPSCVVRHWPDPGRESTGKLFLHHFDVTVRNRILGFLFPDVVTRSGADDISKNVARFCLASRACADLAKSHFSLPEHQLSAYKTARNGAHLWPDDGLPLENSMQLVFALFSHLELRSDIYPQLAPAEAPPRSIHCDGIKVEGLLQSGIAPGWEGKLAGRISLESLSECCQLLGWIQQRRCALDLKLELDTEIAEDEVLNEREKAVLDVLAKGELHWTGNLYLRGEAQHCLASILLPRLQRQAWFATCDGCRVEVIRSAAPVQPVEAPDMAWTRLAEHRKLKPEQRKKFEVAGSFQRMVFPEVDYARVTSMPPVRVLVLDLQGDGTDFPSDWLKGEQQVERLELSMSAIWTDVAEERGLGIDNDDAHLEALAGQRQLRHFLVQLGSMEKLEPALLAILQANRQLKTLTLDYYGASVAGVEIWALLPRLSALREFNVVNLDRFPDAQEMVQFLQACRSLQALRVHANEKIPDRGWLAQVAPAIAAHRGLKVVELHGLALDDLAQMCALQGQGEIELYDGAVSRIVKRPG